MPESSRHGRQSPTVAYIPVTWIPAFPAGMTMILSKSLRRFRLQSQLLRHLFRGRGVKPRRCAASPKTNHPLHARRCQVRFSGSIGQGWPIEVWAAGCGFRPTLKNVPGNGIKRVVGRPCRTGTYQYCGCRTQRSSAFASRFLGEQKMRLAPCDDAEKKVWTRQGAKQVPLEPLRGNRKMGSHP